MATSLDDNDKFAYTASEIFSIVSPYVFHTHAPRVFSEISEALQRAQDASAEVMARLEASETAQEEERRMRAAEARGYVSRLRELQALMKARVEREIEGAKVRKSLKRKLEEECVRSARLEQGLADAEDKRRRLRRKFASEKKALEQWWRSTLDQEVLAARESERSKASSKVEGAMVRRLQSLSTEVAKLRGKLKLLQEENATYAEALRARSPPPSSGHLRGRHGERLPRSESFQRRAKSEISRLSASAAAAAAMDERSTTSSAENSPRSKVSSTLSEFISGISERGLDLAERLRRSISEHASGLGFSPRVSRRRRFFSGEDEDDEEEEEGGNGGGGSAGFDADLSWHPGQLSEPSGTQRQQTCAIAMPGEGAAAFAEGTASTGATPTAVASPAGRYRFDQQETAPPPPPPPPPLTVVSAAAAVDTHTRPVAQEGTPAGSRRRRGLGPFRSPFRGAVVTDAPGPNTPGAADNTALDPVRNGGGGDVSVKSPAAGTMATPSSRWRHQRSLGGGAAAGGPNDPSLRALLASGELFRSTGGRVDGASCGSGSNGEKPSRASGEGLERERAGTTCSGTQQAARTTPPELDQRREPRRLDRGHDTSPTTVTGPPPVGGVGENQPVHGAPSSFHRGGSSGSGVGGGYLSGGLEEGVGHQGREVGNLEGEGDGWGTRPPSCADPAAVGVVAGGCVDGGGAGKAAAGVIVTDCEEEAEEAHVSADLVEEDGLAGARREGGLRHDRHHPLDTTGGSGPSGHGRTSRSGSSGGACDARGEGGVTVDHAGGDRSPRIEGLPQQSTAGPTSAPPEGSSLLFPTTMAVSSNPDVGPRGRKRLDDLFPPRDIGVVGDIAAAAMAVDAPRTDDGGAADADKGTQRPPLDDLLRDMWAVSSVERPGEGDDAGGSVVSSSAADGKVQGARAGGAGTEEEEEEEGLSS